MIMICVKNILHTLTVLTSIITFTTNGMEIVASKKIEKSLPTTNADIYINWPESHRGRHGIFANGLKRVHFPLESELKTIKNAGIEVSLYDPCIPVMVITNNINLQNIAETLHIQNINVMNHDGIISCIHFPRSIPAKYLWNLTTGSSLELTIHGHPVKMTCKKNPKINNEDFHQQFEKRMKKFYARPIFSTTEEELISKKIIIKTITAPDKICYQDGTTITQQFHSYTHGENGYPNEKALAKSIINEQIPQNISYFKALRNRELTGSFKKNR